MTCVPGPKRPGSSKTRSALSRYVCRTDALSNPGRKTPVHEFGVCARVWMAGHWIVTRMRYDLETNATRLLGQPAALPMEFDTN